jgi:hypothetical protein
MTARSPTHGFAARPGDAESWVRKPEPSATRAIAAFQRGMTVADMLRALLDREFPDDGGAAS